MQTTYSTTQTYDVSPTLACAGDYYTPVMPFRPGRAVSAPRPPVVKPPRGVSLADVTELLDAAGPLSAEDIAGGLDAAPEDAAASLWWMREAGYLKQDEWGRYQLPLAMAA